MNVKIKLILSMMLITLTPLVAIGLAELIGITPLAPLMTYFLSILLFIYIYHILVMTGIFFKLGFRWHRKPLFSETFSYVIRSSLLWMLFLPISRVLGDLVKWVLTGEYVELSKGNYHLYIIMLMVIGIGAGAFFSLAYLSVIKKKFARLSK
ncbi:MAG: hypothetical protein QXO98_05375 [Sulfolobales archaeon]